MFLKALNINEEIKKKTKPENKIDFLNFTVCIILRHLGRSQCWRYPTTSLPTSLPTSFDPKS
jgi:hypothetical protein